MKISSNKTRKKVNKLKRKLTKIKRSKTSKTQRMEDIIVLRHPQFQYSSKILGLDYDHTIVKPKSKSTFSKDKDDWQWLRPNVPSIIQQYYQNGYGIVIFTNQTREYKKEQIHTVLNKLNIPYIAYISYNKDYKKPSTEMFEQYIAIGKETNGEFDYKNSIYVGDAMGRQHDWSDSDLKFAINIKISPKTPEEIFPYTIENSNIKNIEGLTDIINDKNNKYLIIMVGYPGSGKSFIAKQFEELEDYVILKGDELKTESNIKKGIRENAENDFNIIIDATHPTKKKRKTFIDLISKYKNYKTVIIHVATPMEISMLNNEKRNGNIKNIVYYVYRKRFEMPTDDEANIVIHIN
jgi:bifunctional polynucleotide phosphatase/kinase